MRSRPALLHSTSHPATFARFTMVAVSVSLIDIGALYALHVGLGVNVFAGRALSFAAALAVGYVLNRRFTFHHRARFRGLVADVVRFYAVFATGALINYGVFAFVVATGRAMGLPPVADFWLPLAGVWLGGLCGMAFNYLFSNILVFQRE